jgi:hypothetical protein
MSRCGASVSICVEFSLSCASVHTGYHGHMPRQIVLVSGPPGAGKTTLAVPLAAQLGFPLLTKDTIKEAIWDAFDPSPADLAWSRRIGGAAMRVLWAVAACCPQAVLEANFRPHSECQFTAEGAQFVYGQSAQALLGQGAQLVRRQAILRCVSLANSVPAGRRSRRGARRRVRTTMWSRSTVPPFE